VVHIVEAEIPPIEVRSNSAKAFKRKLTNYWSIETVEGARARNLCEIERLRERGEEIEAKRRRLDLQKKEQRIKDNCEVQQRCREFRKKERAQGERDTEAEKGKEAKVEHCETRDMGTY
jgi:hypothetical protein